MEVANGSAAGVDAAAEGTSKLKISCDQASDPNGKGQGAMFSPTGSSPGTASRGAGRHHRTEPFFIGVAGGTASGKTTVCDRIIQRLHGEGRAT